MKKFGIQQYQNTRTHSGVEGADPHRLIQMLLEGALEKIAIAKGHMQRKNIAEKGRHINWAISIIGGLQASLDLKAGGEIAENLNNLYVYMMEILTEANIKNDESKLDEATNLLREIKTGWDGIREQALAQFDQGNAKSHKVA